MSEPSQEVVDLREIQRDAVSETAVDGVRGKIDLNTAAQALRDAKLRDAASIAAGDVRPTVFRTKLGGAW